jgi:hypothetical protein
MSKPTDIKEIGPQTGYNRVQLGFTTGTGDIQEVTEWDGKAVENGSTAEEYSEDGLKVMNLHKFFNEKWALWAIINAVEET